jgi:radical SAM protein with 4Fe4S-binding SPASM domain
MKRLLPLTRQRWVWRAPDYREERGDAVLLVWGDVPYWTVVDREGEALLQALDGKHTLGEIIDGRPAWRAQREAILSLLNSLQGAGVFTTSPAHPSLPGPPLYGARIENVAMNLTKRCNLRCRFCYYLPQLTTDTAEELSAAEMVAFLRAVRPCLGKQPVLTILGGEPLLEADKLLTVAEQAIRQRMVVLVSTNGTQVTEAFARRAAVLGLQVQVSLDGPTAALHDAVRGRGAFTRAMAGVRTLVQQRAHTILSMVCHRGNLDSLEAYYRFALASGVNEARFIPLKALGGATDGAFAPVPMDELLRRAFAIFQQHPEFLPLAGRDAFTIQAHTCQYSMRRPSCGTGLQTVLLDANGTLYPCLNTNQPAFRIANMREPGFEFRTVWRTSPVLDAIRRHTVLYHSDHPHAGCPVRYWCLGGCRGENFALTGGLENRPPHCAELRRGIIAMFWMLAERPDLGRPSTKLC